MGRTQHNIPPAARQGKPLQPLPPRISFSGITPPFAAAAGKARYKAATGLGFVKAMSAKLGFKPQQQHGGAQFAEGARSRCDSGAEDAQQLCTLQFRKPNYHPTLGGLRGSSIQRLSSSNMSGAGPSRINRSLTDTCMQETASLSIRLRYQSIPLPEREQKCAPNIIYTI